jgi:hypothetical protein
MRAVTKKEGPGAWRLWAADAEFLPGQEGGDTMTYYVLQDLASIEPGDAYVGFRGLWYRIRPEGPGEFRVEAPDAETAKIEVLRELLRRSIWGA